MAILKNISIFLLGGACLIPLHAGLERSAYPTGYSLSEGAYVPLTSKSVLFPYYIYGNEADIQADYIASGYMGDSQALSIVTTSTDQSAPVSTGRHGKTSLKVHYKPIGREGWVGLYWQTPPNNWGKMKGVGYNLSGATKLTFWARGEKGGEVLSSVKLGGIDGAFPDSDTAFISRLVLTKDWKQYTIPLEGKDLRYIIGGFSLFLRRADNPRGALLYLDEIVYRSAPEKEVPVEEQAALYKEMRGAGKTAASTKAKEPATVAAPVTTVVYKERIVQAPAPPPEIVYRDKIVPGPAPTPKIFYVEKKVMVTPAPQKAPPSPAKKPAVAPKPVASNEVYTYQIVKGAMEVQPSAYGYGYALYRWTKSFFHKVFSFGSEPEAKAAP